MFSAVKTRSGLRFKVIFGMLLVIVLLISQMVFVGAAWQSDNGRYTPTIRTPA